MFCEEEKSLWKRNKGETQSQNSGLWRTRLCLLRAPWTVLKGAFRGTSPACSAYLIIGKFTNREKKEKRKKMEEKKNQELTALEKASEYFRKHNENQDIN